MPRPGPGPPRPIRGRCWRWSRCRRPRRRCTAPVASWMPRIVLPPGPISRPIFSGSIFVRSSRGAYCEISSFGRVMRDQHLAEDLEAGLAGLVERRPDDLGADAVDLQVELDAGDAVLRAGDLEVHVAEVVLVADDVGEQDPLRVGFLDQADRDAGDRIADRHAGGHQAQRRAADAGHRAESRSIPGCRRSRGSCRGTLPASGSTGLTLRSARAPWPISRRPGPRIGRHFADGERREVVVEHELLRVLVDQAVDPLLVAAGAERDGDQGLRLAALEHGRAVHARQHVDLHSMLRSVLLSRPSGRVPERIRSRTTFSSSSCQAVEHPA